MDCIFCKIIDGAVPCKKIYEDEYTLAFMDVAKDVDGHMLVIPKKHVANILDCDADTLRHVMDTVKKIANHLTDECGYSGVNILNASGACADQSIFHFHFHIIPRKKNDGIDSWPRYAGARQELDAVWERLKMT